MISFAPLHDAALPYHSLIYTLQLAHNLLLADMEINP
jgi:hypothetical protein